MDPNKAIGTLTKQMAEELGLAEDVIVAAGSGDNMCAAMGTGASIHQQVASCSALEIDEELLSSCRKRSVLLWHR